MNNKIIICFILAAGICQAQWSYPGCSDVTEADFQVETLIGKSGGVTTDPTLDEPMKMALNVNVNGDVDFYFIERRGAIKHYDGTSQSFSVVGTIDVFHEEYLLNVPPSPQNFVEEGLAGIALDPDFNSNRHIYISYSPLEKSVYRVSRYTLTGDNKLDIASRKVLLEGESQRQDCCHQGGGMAFDDYGDLWINFGSNGGRWAPTQGIDEETRFQSEEWGASSTKSIRGSILRIHPDESARGYSIPQNNFGEYWAGEFEKQGRARDAADYRDTSKVLAELYVKGTRNNFSLALDPVRRWVAWGDVGSESAKADRPPEFEPGSRLNEEHNLVTHPVFAGWPYFEGDNLPFETKDDIDRPVKDVNIPLNDSKWNLEIGGMEFLPPAAPAIHPYLQNCAVTGPIYRYDPANTFAGRLPPHFHRKWFAGDCNTGLAILMDVNDEGTQVLQEEPFMPVQTNKLVDFQAGPDGALYFINYAGWFNSNDATAIMKVSYTGAECNPGPGFVAESAGCKTVGDANFDADATHHDPGDCATGTALQKPDRISPGYLQGKLTFLKVNQALQLPAGAKHVSVLSLTGVLVWSGVNPDMGTLIPGIPAEGVYFVSIK